MPQAPIPAQKIRQLLRLYHGENFNKSQTAKRLKIARTTARRYIEAFNRSALTLSDIEHLGRAQLAAKLFSGHGPAQSDRKIQLLGRLASVHLRIENDGLSILDAWREA